MTPGRLIPKIIRYSLISIGILLLLCMVSSAALLFYLQTGHAQKIIQARINEAIPGTLSWENFYLHPFDGETGLSNFSIQDPTGRRVIFIPKVLLDVDWLPLLKRELTIARLEVTQPQLDIARLSDGTFNIATAFSAPDTDIKKEEKEPAQKPFSLPVNVVAKKITINNGTFLYGDAGKETEIRINGFYFAAGGNLMAQTGRLDTGFAGGHVRLDTIDFPLEACRVAGTFEEGQITVSDVTVAAAGATAVIRNGQAHIQAEPRVDLKLAVDAGLAQISSILDLPRPLTGHAVTELVIKGALNDPDLRLHMAYDGGLLYGFPVTAIEMAAHLSDRTLALSDLAVAAAGGTATLAGTVHLEKAFPDGFLRSTPDFGHADYSLDLNLDHIRIEKMAPEKTPVTGAVKAAFHLSGQGIKPEELTARSSFSVSSDGLQANALTAPCPVKITGQGEIKSNMAALTVFSAAIDGLAVNAAGRLDLSSRQVDATLQAAAEEIAPVARLVGLGNSTGSFLLDAKVTGALTAPALQLQLNGTGLAVKDIFIGDMVANVHLHPDGIIDIAHLAMTNQTARISGSGRLNLRPAGKSGTLPSGPLDIVFEGLEPGLFMANAPFSGAIDGKMAINSVLPAPDLKLQFNGQDLAAYSITIGDISAELVFHQGTLTLNGLDLSNRRSALSISGDAKLLENDSYTLLTVPEMGIKATSAGVYLEDFTPDVSGRLAMEADIRGTTEAAYGHIRLDGHGLSAAGQAIRRMELDADLLGDTVRISPLRLSISSDDALTVTGRLAKDKTYDLALAIDNVALKDIAALKADIFPDGVFSAAVSGRGHLDTPSFSGFAKIENIRMEDKEIADIRLDIAMDNQWITLYGNPDFNLQATYHLTDKTFSVDAGFKETRMDPYFAFLEKPFFTGRLTGQVALSGVADKPATYKGVVDFPELALFYDQQPLVTAKRFNVVLDGAQISVAGIDLLLPDEGTLSVAGKITDNTHLNLETKGNVPLAMLETFSEALAGISGNLSFDTRISGPVSGPEMTGWIQLADAVVVIPQLAHKIHDTNARILLSPRRVTIEQFSGRMDKGKFDIAGNMDLEGVTPAAFSADINAHQIPVSIPDMLDMTLNSELKIRSDMNQSMVSGDVVLIEGLYYKDVNLNPLAGFGRKKRGAVPSTHNGPPGFLDRTELNITVKNRNPFVVDNNLTHMEVVPDLTVKGTAANPIINGRTSVKSGYVEYQKKTFAISKGVIDFINPYETIPTIDIIARSQIRDWLVTLDISGEPDELDFKLSASPHLEDSDILSLILLGKTSQEMRDNDGGGGPSAAQMLSQLMVSQYGEDIKSTTGLDILEAETVQDSGDSGSNGVKVTLGKELSKRMTLKYSAQTENGEVIQRTTAEYKALDDVLLNVFQGNQGNFGGAVKYRLEFR